MGEEEKRARRETELRVADMREKEEKVQALQLALGGNGSPRECMRLLEQFDWDQAKVLEVVKEQQHEEKKQRKIRKILRHAKRAGEEWTDAQALDLLEQVGMRVPEAKELFDAQSKRRKRKLERKALVKQMREIAGSEGQISDDECHALLEEAGWDVGVAAEKWCRRGSLEARKKTSSEEPKASAGNAKKKQQRKVKELMEVLELQGDETKCRALLEICEWEIDRAVEQYFQEKSTAAEEEMALSGGTMGFDTDYIVPSGKQQDMSPRNTSRSSIGFAYSAPPPTEGEEAHIGHIAAGGGIMHPPPPPLSQDQQQPGGQPQQQHQQHQQRDSAIARKQLRKSQAFIQPPMGYNAAGHHSTIIPSPGAAPQPMYAGGYSENPYRNMPTPSMAAYDLGGLAAPGGPSFSQQGNPAFVPAAVPQPPQQQFYENLLFAQPQPVLLPQQSPHDPQQMEQLGKINEFKSITGATDADSIRSLQQAGWDVQKASDSFLCAVFLGVNNS